MRVAFGTFAIATTAWGLAAGPASTARAEDIQIIDERTPWRVCVINGPPVFLEKGESKWIRYSYKRAEPYDPAAPWSAYEIPGRVGKAAPESWAKPEFDDCGWARWQDDMFEQFGGYGFNAAATGDWPVPALLYARTYFGIAEPERASDVKVAVTCVGGEGSLRGPPPRRALLRRAAGESPRWRADRAGLADPPDSEAAEGRLVSLLAPDRGERQDVSSPRPGSRLRL
jgi:hypothetical protein